MRARQNNHPGIEWFEVDLSQYFDDVLTSNALVIGFAHQGKSKTPIDFITSTETLKQYFGEPKTEAEIYFYTACKRILTQRGRLIAVRIPYVNEAENCVPAFTYRVDEAVLQDYTDDENVRHPSEYGKNASYLPVTDVTSEVIANLANRGLTSLKQVGEFLNVTTTKKGQDAIFNGFATVESLKKWDSEKGRFVTEDDDDPDALLKLKTVTNADEIGGSNAWFTILVDSKETMNNLGLATGECNADEDSRFVALTNVYETERTYKDLLNVSGVTPGEFDVKELSGLSKSELSAVFLDKLHNIPGGRSADLSGEMEITYSLGEASDVYCYKVPGSDDGTTYFEGKFLTEGLRSGYYLHGIKAKVKATAKYLFWPKGEAQGVDDKPSSSEGLDSKYTTWETKGFVDIDLFKHNPASPSGDTSSIQLDHYFRVGTNPKNNFEDLVIYESAVNDVSKAKGLECFFGKNGVPEALKDVNRIVRIHRDSKVGYIDSQLAEELEDGNEENIGEILVDKGFVIVNKTNHVLKADKFNNNGEEVLGIVPFVFTGFNKLPLSHLVEPVEGGNPMVFQAVQDITTGSSKDGKVKENVLTRSGFAKPACTYGSFSANADTMSNFVASYFPSLVARDGGELPGEEMNYTAVLVAELSVDPNYDNQVVVTAKELFYGNFEKDSAMYLPRLVTENSDYVAMYSNYKPSTEYTKNLDKMITVVTPYDEDSQLTDFWYLQPVKNGVLGFTSPMCTKLIKYKYIVDTLDSVSNLLANVDESDIDIVVDGGLTSIANLCVRAMGGADNATGVRYDYAPDAYLDYDGGKKNDMPTLLKGGNIRNSADIAVWKTVASKLITFAEVTRKDCYVYIDGPRDLSINYNASLIDKRGKKTIDKDILPYLKYTAGLNSSYGGGVVNWVQEVDDTTGRLYWCPPSVLKAEKTVWCDLTYGYPWYVPAGTERGTINDGVDVSFNPSPRQEDIVYPARWNYVKNIKGDGIVFWGQRNFLTADSMLNRESTRRMMLFVERKCRKAMKRFLFKPISTALMNNVVDTLNPILQDVQDHEGCYDFKVVCNGTNNTPESIMRNELRVSVGIHPTPLAEYIVLGFFCVGLNITITEELLKH